MAAVAGASPVTMTVRTPNVRNSVMSAAESVRGGSLRAMIPASFIASRRTHRDGQHPEALGFQLVRDRGRVGRGLRQARDGGKGSLHDTHGGAARIDRRRLGHLRGRIEGHELAQFRQIGGGWPLRRQSEWPRPRDPARHPNWRERPIPSTCDSSKPGIGWTAVTFSSFSRQRAGFIRAQHLDARRFIHGGEPRGKDAQMGQSPCAERRRQGKGGRQRYGDRRQNRREHQGNDLATPAS